jgi:superfamily I DNA/RNA helicase
LLDSPATRRVCDLVLVYAEYRKYLQSQGFSTYHDEAWRAAGLVNDSPAFNPLADVDVILIDDFHDVDPGQYALIRAIAPPDGSTSVNVFGDPTGARFRASGTSDGYLLDVFPRQYEPFDATLPAGFAVDAALGPAVRALMKETIGDDASAFVPSEAGDSDGDDSGSGGLEVRLVVADDELAEASVVADRVASLLASGRYTPSEVAVAAREKHKYESTLVRAFRERGLVLEAGRTRQHAFAYFVASLLRYVEVPESETARNALTASPYFALLRETYETVAERRAEFDEAKAVEEIRSEVRRTSRSNNGTFDLLRFLENWAKPILSTIDTGHSPVELLTFLGRLADEWVSYVAVVEGTGGRRSISEFLSLSRLLAGDERGAPAVDGRVRFYSCRELSSERFPLVFVVGCSELLFPALPSREDYVPYGALQNLLRTVITDRPVELHAARTGKEFAVADSRVDSGRSGRARYRSLAGAVRPARCLICPRWVRGGTDGPLRQRPVGEGTGGGACDHA